MRTAPIGCLSLILLLVACTTSEGVTGGSAPSSSSGGAPGSDAGPHSSGGAGLGRAGAGGAVTTHDSGLPDAGAGGGGGPAAGGASGVDGGGGARALGGSAGASGAVLDGSIADARSCAAVSAAPPLEGAGHTNAPCDPVTYVSNPPSSGNHYPVWTEFKTYDTPVPEGFWVHSLEHGAVVISYNCPDGCPGEVAAAQSMIDSLPVDPLCYPTGGTSFRRLVMTPDPRLTTRFAASAWGFTLRAACFDPVAFRAFIDAHYGQGPEDFCSAGAYVPADYPATCGE